MAYIDKALLINLFGEKELIELTDRANTGQINDDVLTRAMTTAEAEADSYIGTIYDLPLPSTPPSLVSFVADIARYQLFDGEPTELVAVRYDHAVKWLTNVSKGIVSLGFKKTDVQPTGGAVVVAARDQIFTNALFNKMPKPWHSTND